MHGMIIDLPLTWRNMRVGGSSAPGFGDRDSVDLVNWEKIIINHHDERTQEAEWNY